MEKYFWAVVRQFLVAAIMAVVLTVLTREPIAYWSLEMWLVDIVAVVYFVVTIANMLYVANVTQRGLMGIVETSTLSCFAFDSDSVLVWRSCWSVVVGNVQLR
jgi:hypothetical protein